MIRFLAQSQKGLTSNINSIFKQMAAVDKFKSDQKALNELVQEMLDRQALQEEQIGKIK